MEESGALTLSVLNKNSPYLMAWSSNDHQAFACDLTVRGEKAEVILVQRLTVQESELRTVPVAEGGRLGVGARSRAEECGGGVRDPVRAVCHARAPRRWGPGIR